MNGARLTTTLEELGVLSFIESARHASLVRALSSGPGAGEPQPQPHRLPRLAYLFESRGLARYRAAVAARAQARATEDRDDFRRAFYCWRSLATLPDARGTSNPSSPVSSAGLKLLSDELGSGTMPLDLRLAFHLGVTGLLSESTAETRLELRRFSISSPGEDAAWKELVLANVVGAFVLLVRKDRAWADIDDAIARISTLRELQKKYEDGYLTSTGERANQTLAAVELVGLYHLAQISTLVGAFLTTGNGSPVQALVQLDRHHDRAREAFGSLTQSPLRDLSDLFWAGCRELVNNCIWSHVAGLPESVRSFAAALTSRGRPNPVIELWPSQQQALQKHFLDPYPRAILVEMPTSAGKTLLAKFAIVQTKALVPNGTVVYIVPTRALVNQVTLELRADFKELKPRWRIEQTVPAFELDPTEGRLLQKPPDVLVTTPEKLDLLVRSDHPCVQTISLVIADEAHNIGAKGRGARLELLLGTLKRDRASARFLLLSPFLPNDDELLVWLGEGRHLAPIQVDWTPGNRVVGKIRSQKTKGAHDYSLHFRTLPAADNADVPEGFEIELGTTARKVTTIKGLSAEAVRSLHSRGSILVLCRGRGTASTRAVELAAQRSEVPPSPLLAATCRYLEAEVGRETPLVKCLRRGVAYHHAGMSQEAKWLVEALIRENLVSVVCGTTTLAQGVNFPISTVIVETLVKGDEDLTYQDFWNIAGRAGRTLVDSLGLVAFTSTRSEEIGRFLRGEATEVSSQLAALLERVDEIGSTFNMDIVRRLPELSSLLQFLAHAMRVSGSANLADEVEDLLRASLIYHQASKADAGSASALVTLCRAYINSMKGRDNILKLADSTGFSTPSVLKLLVDKSNRSGFSRLEEWKPERLFGSDVMPLADRVAAVAELPEMKLGQSDVGQFNPQLVAEILRDWVRGDSLDLLASKHWRTRESDPDKRLHVFSTYLFSKLLGQVSWGIGALEGLCLAGREHDLEQVGHVPAMIFFGVRQKEAVWLRMVGVPRIVADGLAELWKAGKKAEPTSHDEIRDWVSGLEDESWKRALPTESNLRPEDMRLLWKQFCA